MRVFLTIWYLLRVQREQRNLLTKMFTKRSVIIFELRKVRFGWYVSVSKWAKKPILKFGNHSRSLFGLLPYLVKAKNT